MKNYLPGLVVMVIIILVVVIVSNINPLFALAFVGVLATSWPYLLIAFGGLASLFVMLTAKLSAR